MEFAVLFTCFIIFVSEYLQFASTVKEKRSAPELINIGKFFIIFLLNSLKHIISNSRVMYKVMFSSINKMNNKNA